MRDVELSLSPTVHLTVPRLEGTIVPLANAAVTPVARDAINVSIDSAEFLFGSDAMTRLMNDYVFTDGAPLRDLVVTTMNDGLHVDARWHFVGVHMIAKVSADHGAIRLHPTSMRPLNPRRLLGLLVDWEKAAENGVRVEGGDILLDVPRLMHKLIRLSGTLTSVAVGNGGLIERFGPDRAASGCAGCLTLDGGRVSIAGHTTQEGAVTLQATPRLSFSFPDAASACGGATPSCSVSVAPCAGNVSTRPFSPEPRPAR